MGFARYISAGLALLLLSSLPAKAKAAGYSVDADCGGVGAPIAIRGANLSGATVRIGAAEARTEYLAAAHPGGQEQVTAHVPAGAVTGPLVLALPGGAELRLLERFVVPKVEVPRVSFTQGVPGYGLVWGKQTLLQIFPVTAAGARCLPGIDGARVWLRLADGSRTAPYAATLGDLQTYFRAPVTAAVQGSVELGINTMLSDLARFGGPEAVERVEYELTRNGQVVASGQQSLPQFTVVKSPPRGAVVYFHGPDGPAPGGLANLQQGLQSMMRVLPVPGEDWRQLISGIYYHTLPQSMPINPQSLDELAPLLSLYQRTLDPRPDFVLGVLDEGAWRPQGSAGGIGFYMEERRLSVSLNDSVLGKTAAHELAHNYDVVPLGAANEDRAFNPAHSKYDEGSASETYCNQRLTFAQSVLDQSQLDPAALHFAVNLDTLTEFPLLPARCTGAAKSVMAYSLGRTSENTFFEISDFAALTQQWSADAPQAGQAGELFAMIGKVNREGRLAIAHLATGSAGLRATPTSTAGGPFALAFIGADGQVLSRHPIHVQEGIDEAELVGFEVVAPLPPETAAVEFQFRGEAIHRIARSEAPLTVELEPPAETETALSSAPVTVRWQAEGPAESRFDLLWSSDGGAHFHPLAIGLQAQEATIYPATLPGGPGLLRVVAADGFRQVHDDVAFTLPDKAPAVTIMPPAVAERERIFQGEPLRLRGVALDREDGRLAQLTWESDRDGSLGTGDQIAVQLSPGLHQITLRATDSLGQAGQAQLSLLVGRNACESPFADLEARHAACGAVAQLTADGLLAGYGDGTFRPEASVSRAEFAKLLVGLLHLETDQGAPRTFSDTAGHWAEREGYIQAAVLTGAFQGFPDGTFRPDAPVSRAEAVKVAAAARSLRPRNDDRYLDVKSSDWYAGWVGAALRAEIVGSQGRAPLFTGSFFLPEQPLTRAEAAQLMANLAQD